MRDDRATLLAEPGLIEPTHVLTVEQRRRAEDLVDGDDSRAADAGHEHVRRAGNFETRLGELTVDREHAALFPFRLALRHDGQEGRTVAAQTGVVLVARRLVDLGLAPELRVHRLHRQAVRLRTAVAAAFAHRLVDVDAERRVLELAPLAQPALLGGAALIVDEDGHARNRAQHPLRLVEPIAVPDFGAATPQRALVVLVRVVRRDDDLLDALGL